MVLAGNMFQALISRLCSAWAYSSWSRLPVCYLPVICNSLLSAACRTAEKFTPARSASKLSHDGIVQFFSLRANRSFCDIPRNQRQPAKRSHQAHFSPRRLMIAFVAPKARHQSYYGERVGHILYDLCRKFLWRVHPLPFLLCRSGSDPAVWNVA